MSMGVATWAAHAHARPLSALVVPPSTLLTKTLAIPYRFELERTASLATDFPATSVTTTYTFHLDPTTGVYEVSTDSLGPVFIERAETLGRYHLSFTASYLHADFETQDGSDLNGQTVPALFETAGLLDPGNTTFSRFDLSSDTIFLTGTAGVTESADIGVVVPIVRTSLAVAQESKSQARAIFGQQRSRATAWGVGDVRVRFKYRLGTYPLRFAPIAELRAPTGAAEDFQGLDAWLLGFGAAASGGWSFFELDGLVRMDVAPEDIERSRVAYGLGISTRLPEPLSNATLQLEFLGLSGISSSSRTDVIPGVLAEQIQAVQLSGLEVENRPGGVAITQSLDRQDRLDLAPGLKVALGSHTVLSAVVIVPVNREGIRPDFVPTLIVEGRF